jgi:thiol-disulfide isomerase/thioredoxin
MNKNIKILITITFILGIIIAYFIVFAQKDNQEMIDTNSIENKQEQTVPEPESTESNTSDSNKSSYIEYSEDNLKMAENTKIVLFFHASWCPSCRALNSDIEKNIDKIPTDITILKTDYDKETELRKKYSITSQHTLVQIDQNGTLIKKMEWWLKIRKYNL